MDLVGVRESRKAKTPSLRYSKGTFTVVRPEGLDIDIEELIEDNFEWFETRLDRARSYREQVPDRCFEEGEVFSILRDDKKVIVEKRRSNSVESDIFLAQHLVERTSIKDQLEKALKSFARSVFERIASSYVSRVEGDFNKIFIRDQDTRWGSCSSKGNLNFNWRLVLGPEHVLEYVVVHELVHLEELNHSKRFWVRVEEICPSYEESRQWLSENSAELVFDTSKY